ncbi:MerR family transcriptional regulator [Psychromonas sp. KJ10-10]|uniref:MerR family transcriptional regulator n=1 Tax=Psychromonas sp. KJ10-10 TaxID=3391823 RepID=UPI0039B69A24
MNIQHFSKLTNLSAHTIRYYEKIGLIKNIERTLSGHRFFTQKDIDWIAFIKRLKDTGMTLKQILLYSELRDIGVSSSEERMNILQEHALMLEAKIEEQQLNLKMLKAKIQYYRDLNE